MFITNEQALGRLESSRNVAHKIVAESLKEQRGLRTIPESLGNKGLVPDVLKPVIAACAIVEGNDAQVARTFGVTPATVRRYKNSENDEAQSLVAGVRELAISKIADVLADVVTNKESGALVNSTVGKNISQIIKNLMPKENSREGDSVNGGKYTFNIITPSVHKDIKHYDVIEVSEPAA